MSKKQIVLLETAWGIIANAGWDDSAKSPGWQEAAVRWRDDYFNSLPSKWSLRRLLNRINYERNHHE